MDYIRCHEDDLNREAGFIYMHSRISTSIHRQKIDPSISLLWLSVEGIVRLTRSRMSASIAPECNDIKEYESFTSIPQHTSQTQLTLWLENMIHASWNGTAKVRLILHTPDKRITHQRSAEYLRGNTASNDCDELFKKYRACLNVWPCSKRPPNKLPG